MDQQRNRIKKGDEKIMNRKKSVITLYSHVPFDDTYKHVMLSIIGENTPLRQVEDESPSDMI